MDLWSHPLCASVFWKKNYAGSAGKISNSSQSHTIGRHGKKWQNLGWVALSWFCSLHFFTPLRIIFNNSFSQNEYNKILHCLNNKELPFCWQGVTGLNLLLRGKWHYHREFLRGEIVSRSLNKAMTNAFASFYYNERIRFVCSSPVYRLKSNTGTLDSVDSE